MFGDELSAQLRDLVHSRDHGVEVVSVDTCGGCAVAYVAVVIEQVSKDCGVFVAQVYAGSCISVTDVPRLDFGCVLMRSRSLAFVTYEQCYLSHTCMLHYSYDERYTYRGAGSS